MPRLAFTAIALKHLTVEKTTIFEGEEMSGLCLRVSPTGSKTWFVRYRLNGRRPRINLGHYPHTTIRQARSEAREILGQVDQARLGRAPDPAASLTRSQNAVTLRELAARYMQIHAKPTKKSWKQDLEIIEAELNPRLGDLLAATIRRGMIDDLLDDIAVVRDSPIYANRVRSCLSVIFNFGKRKELVISNPVAGTTRRPEKERERVLDVDEIAKLWQAWASMKRGVGGVALRLLLVTGQRMTEVLSMREDEIDGDWWTIPGERTKNGRTHRVYLSELAQGLTALRTPMRGWLFVTNQLDDGAQADAPVKRLSKPTMTSSKNSGVTDWTVRDLRTTAGSHMSAIGILEEVRGKIFNHTSRTVTGKHYDMYAYDREKQEALTAYADYLERIVTGKDADVLRGRFSSR